MEENLMCPICGGLHPAGHRDKELEDKLEAIKKIIDEPQPSLQQYEKIKKILGAEG